MRAASAVRSPATMTMTNRPSPAILTLALMCALLSACAASKQPDAVQAVSAPLNDLNLLSAEIPVVLSQALKTPYVLPPAEQACAAAAEELRALDEALGPDLDAPPQPGNPSLIERGSDAAGDAALGALRRTAEGVVPFRGWVRKLSGAERQSRKVAAAIAAGAVRRGFLKGVRAVKSC